MAARRTRTSEKFTHVANLMLRGVLVSKPEHVKPAAMREALRHTLNALRKDVTGGDPALYRALPERIEAAARADRALLNGRIALCHRALRQFWSIYSRLILRRQSHAEYRRAFLADAFAIRAKAQENNFSLRGLTRAFAALRTALIPRAERDPNGLREKFFSCLQKSPSIFCTY